MDMSAIYIPVLLYVYLLYVFAPKLAVSHIMCRSSITSIHPSFLSYQLSGSGTGLHWNCHASATGIQETELFPITGHHSCFCSFIEHSLAAGRN